MITNCIESKENRKLIQRYLCEEGMERCEDIIYSLVMKVIYNNRKQTSKYFFGIAKEFKGLH